MTARNEPSDGVLLKFKYPDGHTSKRRFNLSETIQVGFFCLGLLSGSVDCKTWPV